MSLLAITPQTQARKKDVLEMSVMRDFTGGWNVVDNELNLDPKYSKVLDNFVLREDGALGIRQGTGFLLSLDGVATVGSTIINMMYFQDHIVFVMSDGKLIASEVESFTLGVPVVVWDDTIAGALPGAPSGWQATDFASFASFNGQLIVCNGVDKPLLVDRTEPNTVVYLGDLGSAGANTFVPVCRYVTTLRDFVVMAGDPQYPGRIYISSERTSGTWAIEAGAAPDPNNAVYTDIDKFADVGENYILGLATHRDKVIIAFENEIVMGTLGNIFDDVHEPDFSDVIYAHGSIAHHSMKNTGDDLLSCHVSGVTALSQSLQSGTIEPLRASTLIDPALQESLTSLTVGATTKNIFAVHDLLSRQYMLFVPNHDPNGVPRPLVADPIAIVLDTDPCLLRITMDDHTAQEDEPFVLADAVDFNGLVGLDGTYSVVALIDKDTFVINSGTAASSIDPTGVLQGGGNVCTGLFEFSETIGFVYQTRSRKEKERRAWSRFRGWKWACGCSLPTGRVLFGKDQDVYIYGSDQNAIPWDEDNQTAQTAIKWAWETPWTTFDDRMKSKILKFLDFDTVGDSQFTAMVFADEFYKDNAGQLTPAAQMQFVGGGRQGYGGGSQFFGGSRNTRTERMYAVPVKGKLLKFRLEGLSTQELRVISVQTAYSKGNIRR